ncbi:hypothetical protein [Chitiniphilus shinanonensis]|uniref:hypothetical protein n=1 Tax=Chitiniphilus shinanonensis TaxID=553088 RepID=UPI0030253509
MNASRTPKYRRLINIFNELSAVFMASGDSKLVLLATSLDKALSQFDTPPLPAPASVIATGLEQGLRETPEFFSALPDPLRQQMYATYRTIVERHLPDYFAKDAQHLEKIMTRGKIRNEREWYLVRYQVDLLEGEAQHRDRLDQCYRMLDAFETS